MNNQASYLPYLARTTAEDEHQHRFRSGESMTGNLLSGNEQRFQPFSPSCLSLIGDLAAGYQRHVALPLFTPAVCHDARRVPGTTRSPAVAVR